MCKSSDNEVPKVELKKDFEEISIVVNEEKNENIKFDNNKWTPVLGVLPKSIYDVEDSKIEDEEDEINEEDQEKINILKEEVEKRMKKKEDLNQKIRDIEEKIELMKKILNVDVSEQEYIKDLAGK